ncbi:hypothetical protein TKK_0007454 [Trichogramma kaykai]
MRVDVHGRKLSSMIDDVTRGPAGVGFQYTEDGEHFDLKGKKLTNVASPTDHTDAVNYETFNDITNKLRDLINRKQAEFNEEIAKKTTELGDAINQAHIDFQVKLDSLVKQTEDYENIVLRLIDGDESGEKRIIKMLP